MTAFRIVSDLIITLISVDSYIKYKILYFYIRLPVTVIIRIRCFAAMFVPLETNVSRETLY